MKDIDIIDNFLDNREFRNYVSVLLPKFGYYSIEFDDERVSDEIKENDNDIIVVKEGLKYTVQTYLNTNITEKEINETLNDMENEDVSYGIIITNKNVNDEIKTKASEKGIEIIDRNEIESLI